MKKVILVLLLFTAANSYSQVSDSIVSGSGNSQIITSEDIFSLPNNFLLSKNTKIVFNKSTGELIEIYQIKKVWGKYIYDGIFIQFDSISKIKVIGLYNKGRKTGEWRKFENGEVYIEEWEKGVRLN